MSWLCAAEEFLGFENLAQENALALAIRHLDSDHGLARHRRLDSYRGSSQSHREVVGEIDDLAHFDSGARLEFVHRDDRARLHFDHPTLDAEVRELLLEHARAALELTLVHLRVLGGRQIQQRLRRKFEGTLLTRLGRRHLVALLANFEQPDLERRRPAVDAVVVSLDLIIVTERERDARAVGKFEFIVPRTRSNSIGDPRHQLGRRTLEHQGEPANQPEHDRNQPACDVERIAQLGGDLCAERTTQSSGRADSTKHPRSRARESATRRRLFRVRS